jgi:hypothetical protein
MGTALIIRTVPGSYASSTWKTVFVVGLDRLVGGEVDLKAGKYGSDIRRESREHTSMIHGINGSRAMDVDGS